MNADDKKNRNEEMTLMKIQNTGLNGGALSLLSQEIEEGLEEWTFQAKPVYFFVLNIRICTYINTYVWIYKKYQVATVAKIR